MANTLASSMPLATQIGPDTYVTLAYTLYDEEGDVLDSSDEEEPLSYLHGYGQIVPGLERAIEGMVPGNERSVDRSRRKMGTAITIPRQFSRLNVQTFRARG